MARVRAISLDDIGRAVDRIARRFSPRKVILFGSRVYGHPQDWSDVDLLVVVSNPPSFKEASQIWGELGDETGLPLQIFFMDPEEFEETKDVVGGLAYPASHWGQTLYESSAKDT